MKKKSWLFGVAFKNKHFDQIIEKNHDIDFFEIHTENFFFAKGAAQLGMLEKISEKYLLSMHCVGLSLGSKITDSHLKKVVHLNQKFSPFLLSDHISWSQSPSSKTHINDLLPIPYNLESLEIICNNIKKFQDQCSRNILIENPSSYLSFKSSLMPEWEFINKILEETGCNLLLDINNIVVTANNIQNFNAKQYLQNLNLEKVKEIHLSGHNEENHGNRVVKVDTHVGDICSQTWNLFREFIRMKKSKDSSVAVLVEWDSNVPDDFEKFKKNYYEAKKIYKDMLGMAH
jgi:uncharacterized protein (UPF0276 family)